MSTRRPTLDPDDRYACIILSCSAALAAPHRVGNRRFTKSNRYGLDDNDLDDDDDEDGEEFEYDRESDHGSPFEGHIAYRTPIRIEHESPPRRFSSPFYSYRPHSPIERAISRPPSIAQEVPLAKYQRNSPGSDMEDMRISPEPIRLPSSPKPHSPSSSVHDSHHSFPTFDTNRPYFSPSPPSSVVHAYGTFTPEAKDNYPSFAVPSLLNEVHSPRNSFASEPDLDPNVDSGSCPEVAAVHTELRAEIFERMEKLKVLQVS